MELVNMDNNIKTKEDKMENKDLPQEEIGGPKGLEPTRYGGDDSPEWEVRGRVSDF